jgi:hypothetical protein
LVHLLPGPQANANFTQVLTIDNKVNILVVMLFLISLLNLTQYITIINVLCSTPIHHRGAQAAGGALATSSLARQGARGGERADSNPLRPNRLLQGILSARFRKIDDHFNSLADVTSALKHAGLQRANLIFGQLKRGTLQHVLYIIQEKHVFRLFLL